MFKEISDVIEYKGKKYKLVFNLNVMEAIQDEYKSLDAWGSLTDGEATGEVNVKALIFGLMSMINEGIEIDNEDNGTNTPLLTRKQAGRIITDIGVKTVTDNMNELIVKSTKVEDDDSKNA